MPAERFFHPDLFIENQVLFLKDEEFHHLAHVMRLRTGETIEVINGKGQIAQAHIDKIERHQAMLSLREIADAGSPPSYHLILALAYPRLPRLEYAIEKAIELGITELWLFPGELSEKKELSPSQLQRLNHILISAVKQCGRLFLPKIQLKPPLYAWDYSPFQFPAYFGDTRNEAPSLPALLADDKPASILFFVGPEKGFHTKEIDLLEKKLHVKGASLHQNILRADTAAITATCLASSYLLSCRERSLL